MKSGTGIAGLTVLAAALLVGNAAANDFSITPAFTPTGYVWDVAIDGAADLANPTLYLARGQTYTFQIGSLSGIHSFYVNTESGLGSANAYSGGGLSANGVVSATSITFDVPQDAPDLLFYNCGIHASMAGQIDVVIFRGGFD